MADLRGWRQRRTPWGPNYFIFMQFSAKNRLAPPLWELAPPLRKILDPLLYSNNKKAFQQDATTGVWGRRALYSKVQCIMGNGHMGSHPSEQTRLKTLPSHVAKSDALQRNRFPKLASGRLEPNTKNIHFSSRTVIKTVNKLPNVKGCTVLT